MFSRFTLALFAMLVSGFSFAGGNGTDWGHEQNPDLLIIHEDVNYSLPKDMLALKELLSKKHLRIVNRANVISVYNSGEPFNYAIDLDNELVIFEGVEATTEEVKEVADIIEEISQEHQD